jgi:multidrug efflux pump subunit AcrA (membrane-fusion protein)
MKTWTRKRLIVTVAIVGLCVLGYVRSSGRSKNTYALTTVTSVPRDVSISVSASGDLESEGAMNISAPSIKYSKKVTTLIPEGTIVKDGDVLATFDTIGLEDKLESLLRAGLYAKLQDTEIGRAIGVDDAKANLASKTENEKRARLTHETMAFAPKLEQQKAQIQLNQAIANVKLAENRLKQEEQKWELKLRQVHDLIGQNEKQIEEVRAAIDDLTIRSPAEGLVVYPKTRVMGTERKVQLGDTLYKDQRFMIIPNLLKMTAQIEVAEEEIRRIRVGQKARIHLEAFKDASFSGEIYRIDRLAHVKENNQFIKVFTVGIRISEQDLERLRPGMNARAVIDTDQYEQAPTVPLDAVYSDSNGDYLFVRRNSGIEKLQIHQVDANDEWAVLAEPIEDPVVRIDTEFKRWLKDPEHDDARIDWEVAL